MNYHYEIADMITKKFYLVFSIFVILAYKQENKFSRTRTPRLCTELCNTFTIYSSYNDYDIIVVMLARSLYCSCTQIA